MIEYPQIMASSKAPRKLCIGFEKLDGSNIRVKYTAKRGFELFGSRTQLIDSTHPFLSEVIPIFMQQFSEPLTKIMKDEFRNEREAVVFGEFFGAKSFAGVHELNDPKQFVMFDIMVGHKQPKFMLPQEFVKMFEGKVKIPRVMYRGNLNDQLISDVRSGKYDVFEGLLCKGTERSGAFRGNVWMAKIKTQKYFDALRARYGEEGVTKYGE